MDDVASLAGLDPRLLRRVPPRAQAAYARQAWLGLLSAALAGVSIAYAAVLAAVGPASTLLIGLFAFLFVFNLVRLHHGGGGRPIEGEWDDIDTWRPSLWPTLVLLVLGALMMQGLCLLAMRPFLLSWLPRHLHENGLLAHAHEAWRHPALMGACTLGFAVLFAAFAWGKYFMLSAVRAYERQRWALGRAIVDRLSAVNDELIVAALADEPGFAGEVTHHFANPPYNTHRVLFGVDEGQVEKTGLRFLPPSHGALPPWPSTSSRRR